MTENEKANKLIDEWERDRILNQQPNCFTAKPGMDKEARDFIIKLQQNAFDRWIQQCIKKQKK